MMWEPTTETTNLGRQPSSRSRRWTLTSPSVRTPRVLALRLFAVLGLTFARPADVCRRGDLQAVR